MANEAQNSILFLPGAAGNGSFWKGVGDRLPGARKKRYLDWPGLGCQRARPDVQCMDDLLRLAEEALHGPTAVVAQSMGGIIGIRLALAHPDRITHLVLTATSGGLDVASLGGADWRPDFLAAYPGTAPWILTEKADLSGRLSELSMPVLLLWGDDDPVSPPAVGHHLARCISGGRLAVIPGGRHSLALDRPEEVAALIAGHLAEPPPVRK